jgi:hypothetical protein
MADCAENSRETVFGTENSLARIELFFRTLIKIEEIVAGAPSW